MPTQIQIPEEGEEEISTFKISSASFSVLPLLTSSQRQVLYWLVIWPAKPRNTHAILPFCFSKVSTNSKNWHLQAAANYEHLHPISCRYLQCCCLHARYSCRTSREAQTIGLAWNEGGYFNSFSGKNAFHFVTYTEVKKDTMMETTLLHTQLINKYLNNNKYKEQHIIKH